MTILSDRQLIALGTDIISPFYSKSISQDYVQERLLQFPDDPAEAVGKIISYGVSSYGYDVRVKDEYLIYHNAFATVIDPKDFNRDNFIRYGGKGYVLVPPNSFILCETIEYVKVPENCVATVMAKSTYARCGLVTNATILEPGWEGTVTLELSNTTPLPIKVYSGEGIVQLVFHQAAERCLTSYADRKGKYNQQSGITPPKV